MGIKIRYDYEAGDTDQQEAIITELINLPPGRYRVYLMDEKPNRRPQANAYYWKVVLGIICHHTGVDKFQMHEHFKKLFNPETTLTAKGELVTEGATTTDLNTKEFTDFVEAVIIYATTELGLMIPEASRLPDEILIDLDTKKNAKIWK